MSLCYTAVFVEDEMNDCNCNDAIDVEFVIYCFGIQNHLGCSALNK